MPGTINGLFHQDTAILPSLKNQNLLTSTGIKITGKISLSLRKTDISHRQRLQR
jgi:hypothetical protein